jgi:hypothetical protein
MRDRCEAAGLGQVQDPAVSNRKTTEKGEQHAKRTIDEAPIFTFVGFWRDSGGDRRFSANRPAGLCFCYRRQHQRRLCRKPYARIKKHVTPHTLRHSWATSCWRREQTCVRFRSCSATWIWRPPPGISICRSDTCRQCRTHWSIYNFQALAGYPASITGMPSLPSAMFMFAPQREQRQAANGELVSCELVGGWHHRAQPHCATTGISMQADRHFLILAASKASRRCDRTSRSTCVFDPALPPYNPILACVQLTKLPACDELSPSLPYPVRLFQPLHPFNADHFSP